MSKETIHPDTDYQLVREIYAAAAAAKIAAPPPAASGVAAFGPGGINFDSILEKSVKAASVLAAFEAKRTNESTDAYLKSLSPKRD